MSEGGIPSNKVHRLILSLYLLSLCQCVEVGARLGSASWKRGSYLEPQHGSVRRRSTARSTLSGSSVKTYRKASMHRKKPKIISYKDTSHTATPLTQNSQNHLGMTYSSVGLVSCWNNRGISKSKLVLLPIIKIYIFEFR